MITIVNKVSDHFLKDKLSLVAQRKNILDVGGSGRFSKGLAKYKYLFENSNFRSFDMPGVGADIEGDIHNMPIETESEDAVICNAVLEHVTDPIRAVEEIRRILKKRRNSIYSSTFYLSISC